MKYEEKIDKIIKQLEEIKTEEKDRRSKIKDRILDKLANDECNYFYIVREDMTSEFKVYAMKCDSYEEAYDKCEDISGDNAWLLHKDEIEEMIACLETPTKMEKLK